MIFVFVFVLPIFDGVIMDGHPILWVVDAGLDGIHHSKINACSFKAFQGSSSNATQNLWKETEVSILKKSNTVSPAPTGLEPSLSWSRMDHHFAPRHAGWLLNSVQYICGWQTSQCWHKNIKYQKEMRLFWINEINVYQRLMQKKVHEVLLVNHNRRSQYQNISCSAKQPNSYNVVTQSQQKRCSTRDWPNFTIHC